MSKFAEILPKLEAGKCAYRESWDSPFFIYKAVQTSIKKPGIPYMSSLPEEAKVLIGKWDSDPTREYSFLHQIMIVNRNNHYIAPWAETHEDLFADDWHILEPNK